MMCIYLDTLQMFALPLFAVLRPFTYGLSHFSILFINLFSRDKAGSLAPVPSNARLGSATTLEAIRATL